MATDLTTASITPEVQTYYEKVFLARAKYELVLKEGGQKRTHGTNSGRTVNFTRYTPLTVVTAPITESCNPAVCLITACTVSMTLSEYGLTVNCSKLLSLVSIDKNMAEKISLVGQNMGETINTLVAAELANGTAYWPNSHTLSTVAAGDTLSASAIREMVKTLEANKANAYQDGNYIGKTNPLSKYSLLGDSTWINAHTYKDGKELYNGEMGELYQVRWMLNKGTTSAIGYSGNAASAVVQYYTFVHGTDAFGVYDLEGDQPKLYILPNLQDSGSPAGRISKVSWAGSFATKILNSDWALVAKFTSA
jgi:N4-gp56 family major capsid protein